jgi:hypothetical protein
MPITLTPTLTLALQHPPACDQLRSLCDAHSYPLLCYQVSEAVKSSLPMFEAPACIYTLSRVHITQPTIGTCGGYQLATT